MGKMLVLSSDKKESCVVALHLFSSALCSPCEHNLTTELSDWTLRLDRKLVGPGKPCVMVEELEKSQHALLRPAGAVALSQGPSCCQSSQDQVRTAKVCLI